MSSNELTRAADAALARMKCGGRAASGSRARGWFEIHCYGPDGRLKWRDRSRNLVVDEGLIFIHNAGLGTGNRYVGLKGAGAVAPGDTMGAGKAWSELTDYTQGTRPLWQIVQPVVSTTSTNTANPAVFSINASITVAGAFLTTDNTKGGGSGTLIAAVDFTNGTKNPGAGDTLEVIYQYSHTDDGA